MQLSGHGKAGYPEPAGNKALTSHHLTLVSMYCAPADVLGCAELSNTQGLGRSFSDS